MKSLTHLALNFQNRLNISNTTAINMIDYMPRAKNLEELSIILKGTAVDDLIAYKLSNELDEKMDLKNKVILI